MEENKKKLFLVSAIGIVLAGVFMWYMLFASEQTPQSKTRQRTVAIPDSERDTISIKSKAELYRQQKRKSEETISNSDFYDVAEDTKSDLQETPTASTSFSRSDDGSYQEVPVKRSYSSSRRTVKAEPQQVVSAPVAVVEKPQYEDSGFGISQKSKSNTSQGTKKSNETIDNFYSAYLEDDVTVLTGQTVVFILSSNAVINGHALKKNSLLFGQAKDTGSKFDIVINQAKNTDGTMVSIRNTFVYNENYSRGIEHSGKLTKALNNSAENTTEDISSQVNTSASGTIVALGASAVDNTVKAFNRQKVNEIPLQQGYKIYVKTDI